MSDWCAAAREGQLCPDDLCHTATYETLCGMNVEVLEEMWDEEDAEEEQW